MDQSNSTAYNQTKSLLADVGADGRPWTDERQPQGPRVLQKKRSYAGLQESGASKVRTSPTTQATNQRGPAGGGEINKAKKGSLRYAVRRLFGRKSKEPEPQLSQTSPQRHGYHQSETSGLIARNELSPSRSRDDALVQRTRSTPIAAIATGDIQRTRSPYTMQFPHSARLKPLDLGNPFATSTEQPLRRRKTLPSVQIAELDATALSASVDSPNKLLRIRRSSQDRDDSMPVREDSVRRSKREKRRSRSAGDLRQSQGQAYGSPQKTSEDMRRWRESWQGSVLRVSGFTTNSPLAAAVRARQEEDRTPMPRLDDPFVSDMPEVTPTYGRGLGEGAGGDAAVFGTDYTSELEDRVARLEQGLLSFRGQLAQLSADRNRRTVLIGGVQQRPRASSGGRTASLLATDLQQDLSPSTYQYDYSQGARPSTSPPPPRTPTRTDPSSVTPTFSFHDRGASDPFVSPPRTTNVRMENASAANSTQPPQHTFRSLYEMLADERSARRRLEMQMKSLRTEIANLHYQVSQQSNVQSQRSSYYANADPMVGSSRLHALLQDPQNISPPGTAQSGFQQQEAQSRFATDDQGLMSRFSGSESEAVWAEDTDDMQTPYDAYQTPVEQQGTFPFAEPRRGAGGMF